MQSLQTALPHASQFIIILSDRHVRQAGSLQMGQNACHARRGRSQRGVVCGGCESDGFGSCSARTLSASRLSRMQRVHTVTVQYLHFLPPLVAVKSGACCET